MKYQKDDNNLIININFKYYGFWNLNDILSCPVQSMKTILINS